jgi:hypothetical protein
VGQFPEFIQGRLGLVGRLGEQRSGLAVAVGLGVGVGEPEVVGEGQQALLGAVVQVAFQPPAFAVAGLDDADVSPVSTMRTREARSWSSWASASACSRSFSSASSTAAPSSRSRSGSAAV